MDIVDRLNAALDYIEDNLSGEIDYGEIAKSACFSPYHFQRTFAAIADVPLSEYIRRRRLTQAGLELQKGESKIIDVAMRCGYSSPDAFARAFKALHGVVPSKVSSGVTLKAYPRLVFTLSIKGVVAMDYKIVEKEAFKIVGMKMGMITADEQNVQKIPKMWSDLSQEKADEILSLADTDLTGIMGVCADIDDGGFDYWIASATTKPCPPDLEEREIPASIWAVFESIGPMPHAIQDTWKRVLSEWLPNSGYEHAGTPDLEWYSDGDSSAEDYKSQVWVPVREK